VDKQLFDMMNTRFDSLDRRFDTSDATSQATLKVVQSVDKKVVINQTHITWLRWSLRGVWASAFTGLVGWFGTR